MRIGGALLAFGLAVLPGLTARAADLPSAKAEPVDYVRVCNVHGAGFWYIPGTDTCIKLSGRVRAEFQYASPSWQLPGDGRNVDATGFLANGRLNADIRTATDWGLLRAFIRYDFYRLSGSYLEDGFSASGSFSTLDRAFIQFGGLTAGRLTSFFDFYANELNWRSIAGSDNTVQAFAYTATFGQGFSATLSIEDQTERYWGPTGVYPDFLHPRFDYTLPWYGTYPVGPGGTRMPDLVASLRLDQPWGAAQLSGALHQIRYPSTQNFVLRSDVFDNPPRLFTCSDNPFSVICDPSIGTDYGYAVQAGVQINLPSLAQGDALYLQAAYAKGAVTYLGVGNVATNFGPVGPWAFTSDAAVFPVVGSNGVFTGQFETKPTSGYALTAAFLHYWTPSLRQGLFGSFLSLSNPQSQAPDFFGDGRTYSYGPNDLKIWQVGTNLIWSPVAGLDIGAEVGYIKADNRSTPIALTNPFTEVPLLESKQDQVYTRIRIQREF